MSKGPHKKDYKVSVCKNELKGIYLVYYIDPITKKRTTRSLGKNSINLPDNKIEEFRLKIQNVINNPRNLDKTFMKELEINDNELYQLIYSKALKDLQKEEMCEKVTKDSAVDFMSNGEYKLSVLELLNHNRKHYEVVEEEELKQLASGGYKRVIHQIAYRFEEDGTYTQVINVTITKNGNTTKIKSSVKNFPD
ncbi:MAG: hypothetical protein E7H54_05205 [Clostridium perfringens]|uniref:hypothetical protein n=1 Tax=Clostridium perfringens TaxID=1502 RepID=UPI0024BCFAC3|nr:hypothetical protein [Clostridium perfringens]MDU8988560.1 hypothetical protein [Clostridium perfringens]